MQGDAQLSYHVDVWLRRPRGSRLCGLASKQIIEEHTVRLSWAASAG
jgi:hypothetical protein